MKRTATRTALVTLALLSLAACVVNLSFDMKKTVALRSQGGAQTVSLTEPVSLGDYKEITDHKDNIKSLDLDSLDAKIVTLGPANTAHKINGTIALRKTLSDTTHDVPVGTLTNVDVAANSSVHIAGSPQLDAFLLQQLQDAGTFYVVVNGTVDGTADITAMDLTMHVSMGYDAGLF